MGQSGAVSGELYGAVLERCRPAKTAGRAVNSGGVQGGDWTENPASVSRRCTVVRDTPKTQFSHGKAWGDEKGE